MVIMCVLQGGKLPGLNAISGSFTSKTMLWAMSLTPCRVRSRKQTTSTDWKLPLLVSAPDVYVSVFSRKEKRELTSELRQTQLERIQVTVKYIPLTPLGETAFTSEILSTSTYAPFVQASRGWVWNGL